MAGASDSDRGEQKLGAVDRIATVAVVAGGLLMSALFIPFTLAHGPTSFNEERVILGLDMHGWGVLLGLLPNLLIGWGLWRWRQPIAGHRRAAIVVLATVCFVMFADALANLAFGGLAAPLALFILAPTTLALAALTRAPGAAGVRLRVLLAALGITLAGGVALALIPNETADSYGGYRVFGIVAYGVAGILWSLVGANLPARRAIPDVRAHE